MKFYIGPWIGIPASAAPPSDALALPGAVPWPRRVPPLGSLWGMNFSSLPEMEESIAETGVGVFVTDDATTLPSQYSWILQGDWNTPPAAGRRGIWASRLRVPAPSGSTLRQWLVQACIDHGQVGGVIRFQPFLPTARRRWEIPLHGAPTYTLAFDPNAPNAALVRQRYQADYEAIRTRARNGEMRTKFGVVDTEAHRRFADAVGQELGIDNIEDWIIPAHLPKESRLSAGTQYTEDFNGADKAGVGYVYSWTEVVGTAGENKNNRYESTNAGGDSHCRMEQDCGSTNHNSTATVANYGISGGQVSVGAVCVRFKSDADTLYTGQVVYYAGTRNRGIGVWSAGSETYPIGSYGTNDPTNGQTIKLDASGTTLTFYVNGASETSVSDSTISGNTRQGIRAYTASGGYFYLDSAILDDGISAGGGTIRRIPPNLLGGMDALRGNMQ